MDFKNFIFQAWKVMDFNCRSLKAKSWKIKVVFGSLVTVDGHDRTL